MERIVGIRKSKGIGLVWRNRPTMWCAGQMLRPAGRFRYVGLRQVFLIREGWESCGGFGTGGP